MPERSVTPVRWVALILMLVGNWACIPIGGCDPIGCGVQDDASTLHFVDIGWRDHQAARFRFMVSHAGVDVVCEGMLDDIACDDDSVSLGRFMSGQGVNAYRGISDLVIDGYPDTARLVVERDDVVVHDATYAPEEVEERAGNCTVCTGWSQEVSW